MQRKKSRFGGPLGKIEKLVLENFKSYEGVREIGPFQKFTCVIGPNGSGKSNVMDAISFCLGISAKHLRGDKLKDLVHRKEKESSEENTRSARVTLHFRTVKGDVMLFGRSVNAAGHGTYTCGPIDRVRNVNYDQFLQQLAAQGIMVKARNFLVFQGDVMELARQQGQELCNVIETLSGSEQFKEEYSRLSHNLDAAHEKARMHFQHLVELKGTVALLEKQRAEVEKYNELRAKMQDLEVESYLFTLYCGDADANRHREELSRMRSELQRMEAEVRRKRKEMEEKEAEGKHCKSKSEEVNNRLFIVASNLNQLEPEISSGKKKVQHYRKKVQETARSIEDEDQRHKVVEVQLQQIRNDKAEAESKLAKIDSKPSSEELLVNLTPQQRIEYNEAVKKTGMLNVRIREQLREASEEHANLNGELGIAKADLKALDEKRGQLELKLKEFDGNKRTLEAAIQQEKEELQNNRHQLKRVKDGLSEFQRFNSNLNLEAQTLMKKLDGAHTRREKLERVEEKQRIADELRNAFPQGVIGRVSELMLPTQRRFDLAIQMCMGKFPDAFIVTDAKTGFACARYMKEKRIKQEDFLLMDRIRISQAGPMQKLTVNTKRHLAFMCVQHNEKFFERHPQWQVSGPAYIDTVIKHLLNNSVIVDDIQEAKTCAYRDAPKHGLKARVVTLDGEVISSNGNMSVQHISQQNRVEFGGAEEIAEIRRQESKLEQIRQDRAEIQDRHRKDQDQQRDLEEQIRLTEGRKASHEERLRRLESEKTSEEKTVDAWKARSEELAGKVERTAATIESVDRKQQRLDSELLKVGKKYFVRLSQELGVEDVREIMTKEEALKRKKQKERQELEDFIFTTSTEETNLQRRLEKQSKLNSLKLSLQQYVQETTREEERLEQMTVKHKSLKTQHEEEIAQARALSQQKEKLEEETRALKGEMFHLRLENDDVKKKVRKTGEQLKIILMATCSIYRECQDKQVELPFLSADHVKMEMILNREKDLEAMQRDDLDNACLAITVNFSPLPEQKKEVARQTTVFDAKHVQVEYQNAIKALQLERDTLNPNMKSLEQCNIESEKMQEVKGKAEEAAELSKKLEGEFDKVKTERTKLFMECFRHIESKVHPFYKELTTYDDVEGGSAYLDLDDPEEPYRGGITFTACPPGKRFFPMSQLSGGEKSMASMALLFAMHSFRPPPFMILDEVDAPFDRKNTNSLVSYCKKLGFQCIVISLKDTFFMHSEGIIGICKDQKAETSASLTFNLDRMMSVLDEQKASMLGEGAGSVRKAAGPLRVAAGTARTTSGPPRGAPGSARTAAGSTPLHAGGDEDRISTKCEPPTPRMSINSPSPSAREEDERGALTRKRQAVFEVEDIT